jgi:ABC-type cobalamin/Fe3+-siderophores transport system ATPase subunit
MTHDNRDKIRVNALDYSFDAAPVLSRISFSCAPGSILAVLGPNGSGKTTLLRALFGWFKPARRAVLIDGRDILSYTRREAARLIAHVTQSAEAESEFTVRETVLMGRAPHLRFFERESHVDLEKVNEALAITDLTSLADRDISTLSGGEWKRVMLAQALAQDAEILLLDEPTAHLDLSHQEDILRLLHKMRNEKGITIVIVLHDLNSAALYTERIILLSRGTIAADGTPEQVLTREKIKEVYGVEVLVIPHPVSGKPCVLPGGT